MNNEIYNSLAEELIILNTRTADFSGLQEESRNQFLASNLRILLGRYLPPVVGTGFGYVLENGACSAKMEVILFQNTAMLPHREGNFVVVPKEKVLAIIVLEKGTVELPEVAVMEFPTEKMTGREARDAVAHFLGNLFTHVTGSPVQTAPVNTSEGESLESQTAFTGKPEEKTDTPAEKDITEPKVVQEVKESEKADSNEEDISTPELVIPVKKPSRKVNSRKNGVISKSRKRLMVNDNNSGNTPLHIAVIEGDLRKVGQLIEGRSLPIEGKNKEGNTALHLAAVHGQHDIAQLLISNGADVNARNYVYDSPLHLAVVDNHHEIVYALLDHGAEVETRNNRAHTPLHKAAIHDSPESAEVLIKNYADVNAMMEKDMQPLHLAAWYGSSDVASLLIDYGADMNAINSDGNTALHFAAFNGQVKAIKILINNDADPTIVNRSGETYLQSINEGYRGEMIKVLE